MSKIEQISVALPPDMAAAVHEAVSSGEYASAGEVIREALRDWASQRESEALELDELRRLVQEGIDSGPGEDGEAVFARLHAKYAAMAKAK